MTARPIVLDHHNNDKGMYLKDFVFGAMDGTVTTFAVVAGVVGASLSPSIVLIMGFANLFADGFSMAVGNYISTKSEIEFIRKERNREEEEIHKYPNEERRVLRSLYIRKGFHGSVLDQVVRTITGNKKAWVDTVMREELGITDLNKTPLHSALATFAAFVLIGIVPLIAYLGSLVHPVFRTNTFLITCILTGAAFFVVGSAKGMVVKRIWWKSGLETFAIGSAAAIIAFLVGFLLRGLAG